MDSNVRDYRRVARYFQTKNTNLGKFLKISQWMMLVYFMTIWSILSSLWYILWPFGIFYGFMVYFSRFGMLYQENSGNPGLPLFVPKPSYKIWSDFFLYPILVPVSRERLKKVIAGEQQCCIVC
jgi:hypothetical protein